MPVIPAHRKLRQDDCEFQVSSGYVARFLSQHPFSPPPKKVSIEMKYLSVCRGLQDPEDTKILGHSSLLYKMQDPHRTYHVFLCTLIIPRLAMQ
jgi:hypothetical protein